MSKKKKRFTENYEFPAFMVRVTEQRVDIENLAKTWKLVYGVSTYEYGIISNMILNEEGRSVLNMIFQGMYSSSLMFRDAQLVNDLLVAVTNATERIMNKPSIPSEQSDEEILAEQKALYEKDEESINKHHKITNNGN